MLRIASIHHIPASVACSLLHTSRYFHVHYYRFSKFDTTDDPIYNIQSQVIDIILSTYSPLLLRHSDCRLQRGDSGLRAPDPIRSEAATSNHLVLLAIEID